MRRWPEATSASGICSVVAADSHPRLAGHGVRPGERLPLDLFCALDHAFSSPAGKRTGLVDQALAQVDRTRRVKLTLPQFHSVAVAVSQGDLIATLPAAIARKYAPMLGLSAYEPPFDIPPMRLQLYWHRRHDADEAHAWLRRKVLGILARYDDSQVKNRR